MLMLIFRFRFCRAAGCCAADGWLLPPDYFAAMLRLRRLFIVSPPLRR